MLFSGCGKIHTTLNVRLMCRCFEIAISCNHARTTPGIIPGYGLLPSIHLSTSQPIDLPTMDHHVQYVIREDKYEVEGSDQVIFYSFTPKVHKQIIVCNPSKFSWMTILIHEINLH